MVNSHVSSILHEESFITKPLFIFLKHPSHSLSLSLTHTRTHTNTYTEHTIIALLNPLTFEANCFSSRMYTYMLCATRFIQTNNTKWLFIRFCALLSIWFSLFSCSFLVVSVSVILMTNRVTTPSLSPALATLRQRSGPSICAILEVCAPFLNDPFEYLIH